MIKLHTNNNFYPPIDENTYTDEQVIEKLNVLKTELKNQMIVLGHHYQQDDIISFADITGDSLGLAQKVSTLKTPYIVFCGVHFMAETADMLTSNNQKVILPDLEAGCSMADMANINEINNSWDYLKSCTNKKIIPITYVNCSADLKAFVGENDGSICTSSNAKKIISWGLEKGEKLLFFPDQHLGRNTCHDLGISLKEMVVYNPNLINGGLTKEEVQAAKVILWYGYCSVHQGFTKQHIQKIKQDNPKTNIIVHPECPFEVVQNSDFHGSTSYIIDKIDKSKDNTSWAVGTEINLINRLSNRYKNKKIFSLSPYQCLCTTMYRVRPRWLLKTFESIRDNKPINVINVPENIKNSSLKALNTMLEI